MDALTIFHINTQTSWGGGENQTLELIRGLSDLGHHNVLFCRSSSALAEHAEKNGISSIHLPFRGEFDLYSALRLRAWVKRQKVDIVHAHEAHAHSVALLALLGLDFPRLVVSRRVAFPLRSWFSRKIKYSFGVKKIIAVSDAIRNILIADGIDPRRIVTIRDGVAPWLLENSLKIADSKKAFGLTDKQMVISTVASLTSNKGHLSLLKAATGVVKKHPEVIFLFAGEGENRPKIEKEIHTHGLEKNVRLLGFQTDVASVYRASDIYTVPSREEGLCSSIQEAMCFGLPIVATRTGGIPELVHHGDNGFLVPVDNDEALAECLLDLIENRENRQKMGEQSALLAKENQIGYTVEKTLAVYRGISRDFKRRNGTSHH
ncbi:MAG: glycosyltransferase [Candidatus Latescibacterota bacterium]